MNQKSIAIIGSGISGLSAAYFLSDKYKFKLFEKNNYLGGHSNTVKINYNQKDISVDTGFIVFNHETYPNLKNFFELLNVEYEKSNMSFGVKIDNSRIEYAGTNLKTIFAQTKNIINPKFLLMLYEILKFNKNAIKILEKEFNPNYTLKNFLEENKASKYFREYYLLPMSGAIWSCPINTILSYPAQIFIRFFKNHGLLNVLNRPQWYTVKNGSIEYIKKITRKINGNFSLNDEVISVKRTEDNKIFIKSKNSEESFDLLIYACHANQILSTLENPNKKEVEIFSSFKYQENNAFLHCDESVMPINKNAWASWIYSKNNNDKKYKNISVSYWMNNLQNIDFNHPLFVTLNPNQQISENKIFAKFKYAHPIFDSEAINAQKSINEIQGSDRIFYCGAYQKYGFHEDGISSAISVLNKLNIFLPWQ